MISRKARPSRPKTRSTSPSTARVSGGADAGRERYTRDGSLQINSQGQLVAAAGNPVLAPAVRSCSSRPTRRSASPPTAASVCSRRQPDRLGPRKLRLVSFAQAQRLVKEGSNFYSSGAGNAAQPDATSKVRQGFVEKSNVNSVAEMSKMIEVTRAYTQISGCCSSKAICGNPHSINWPTFRPKENHHARSLYRGDGNGGPGTQRPGHLHNIATCAPRLQEQRAAFQT